MKLAFIFFFILNFNLFANGNDPLEILENIYGRYSSEITSAECSNKLHLLHKNTNIPIDLTDLYKLSVLTNEKGYANIFDNRMENDYEILRSKYYKAIYNNQPSELIKIVHDPRFSWQLSSHPLTEIRKISLFFNSLVVENNLSNNNDFINYLESIDKEVSFNISEKEIKSIENQWAQTTYGYRDPMQVEKFSQIHKLALCSSYTLVNAYGCLKSLNKIINLMRIKGIKGIMFSLPDLLLKIIKDPIYWRGAQKTAIKILNRIKNKDHDGKLFDDIKQSFIELGLSENESIEKSWDLIGLYSTRGSRIGEDLYLLSKELKPFALSMSAIGYGMNVLDSEQFKVGKNYSYPQSIEVSFDKGKPYHFWLAAYLARTIVKETDQIKSAPIATYLLALGYQITSTTIGRGSHINTLTMESNAPEINKSRMDLVYATAGGFFGSNSLQNHEKKLNLDQALIKMINESVPLQPLSMSQAMSAWNNSPGGVKGYIRWKKLVNPDAALDYFSK